MISLHAEVPANEDVLALHDEIDNVEKELREEAGCDAVIHMDPVVTDDGVTEETRRRVQTLIHCIDDAIDIHDFRMVAGPTHTNLIFDAVVPSASASRTRRWSRKSAAPCGRWTAITTPW